MTRRMIERIREFASQSHLDVYSLGLDREKWDAALNNFAELIARDCEKLLREEGERAKIQAFTGSTYKFTYMNEAANVIKRHFGIE